MNSLMKRIAEMYVAEKAGTSNVCLACKASSNEKGKTNLGPIPIYHVGDKFENDKKKVAIVGLAAYGWDEVIGDRSLANEDDTLKIMQKVRDCFIKRINEDKKPYISTIRDILIQSYGTLENGLDRVAITNVVHCNLGQVSNGVTTDMRAYCAHSGQGFLLTKKELDILNPNRILALAGSRGNDYLKDHWGLDQNIIKYKMNPSARGTARQEYVSDIVSFINT